MSGGDLIHVVNSGGKRFFFNLRETSSGKKYLCINAVAGDYKDRLVVFPNQITEVWRGMGKAMEVLTGVTPMGGGRSGVTYKCPGCGEIFTDESDPEVFGTYAEQGSIYCNHWGCPRGVKHPIRQEICYTWEDTHE